MVEEIFSVFELDKKESEAYLTLLKHGSLRASELARQLSIPRTTSQNILARLEQKNLVSKSLEKKVQFFSAVHPENLVRLLESKKMELVSDYDLQISKYKKLLPELLSIQQSFKSIPQVEFYRGRSGARQVLFDTLNSKTELKDFANVDAMFEHIEDINNEYVELREKSTVTKRSLILDTPFARSLHESGNYSPSSHKGYKWIQSSLYPFSLEMNIYDGKVSYLTYVENDITGVIIKNDHIYQMHESMWKLHWDLLPYPKGQPVRAVGE